MSSTGSGTIQDGLSSSRTSHHSVVQPKLLNITAVDLQGAFQEDKRRHEFNYQASVGITLLMSQWPNQVLWSSAERVWEGSMQACRRQGEVLWRPPIYQSTPKRAGRLCRLSLPSCQWLGKDASPNIRPMILQFQKFTAIGVHLAPSFSLQLPLIYRPYQRNEFRLSCFYFKILSPLLLL